MSNKYNKIIKIDLPVRTRRARPKGRKFSNVSISLTQEQIDWLQKQPNASEMIRKILQDLIDVSKDVEPKLEVISLHNQLTELEKELWKITNERNEFHQANWRHWKKVLNPDGSVYRDDHGNEFLDLDHDFNRYYTSPKLIDNSENAQVALRVLNGYNEAIKTIEQKIADVKAKILQLE